MQNSIVYDPRAIARHNPRLAYILECVQVPLVPRVYKFVATFTTGTIGTVVGPVHLSKPMSSDAWIWQMEYTIRTPNAFTGNPLKPVFEVNNARAPYVDMDLAFIGRGPGTDIRVTAAPTPIETICKLAGNPEPYDSAVGSWHVIQKDQDVEANFYIQRTLGQAELPYIVTVAVKMYELDRCSICEIPDKDAREWLCSKGLLESRGQTPQGG